MTDEYERHQKKKTDSNTSSGGSYYNTLAAYLGYGFMELAFGLSGLLMNGES